MAKCLGESNGNSKLTIQTVIEIKKQLQFGTTQVAIAKQFGVNQSTISDVSRGFTWAKS